MACSQIKYCIFHNAYHPNRLQLLLSKARCSSCQSLGANILAILLNTYDCVLSDSSDLTSLKKSFFSDESIPFSSSITEKSHIYDM